MLDGLIADINAVDNPWGIILFIVNIFLPGIGSIINSLMGGDGVHTTTLIVGIVQLLTCWILIGWIWSIWWGYLIWQKQK
mmetsp:Transcript_2310/g.1653  ORF Transcript_2310/g.1653 Transcript_2310/m.1653 type:complete len:80 (+) Transcript_2310:20-259(+)